MLDNECEKMRVGVGPAQQLEFHKKWLEEKKIMTIETININNFLEYADAHDYGDIHFKVDPKTGLHAIIAIHNTKLGPSLGGCRFMEYPDTGSALYDVMRLARGMSYKSACAGLPLGGGKSVIIKPKHIANKHAFFESFGEFVENLGGRYITADDSGTGVEEMDMIRKRTSYVASGSHLKGEPSPFTAQGVKHGIDAAVLFKLGKTSLDGLHVAIQGVGKVGYFLAEHLVNAGARITVADVNSIACEKAKKELGAEVVSVDAIHKVNCDVYSPCALGASLNDRTIPDIRASIIAGAANNQLAHHTHGEQLFQRGILYAPDYVINAGGVIHCAYQYDAKMVQNPDKQIERIYDTLLTVFERSKTENKPTDHVADQIAEEILFK